MELFNEIFENKFLLVLLTEQQYEKRLSEMIKNLEKDHKTICYICLSRPYKEIASSLQSAGFSLDKFFFIDVLTSHYKKPANIDNCIFLQDPSGLAALQYAIARAVSEKHCSVIIFDTISSLLMYEQTHDIVRFTHQLTIEETYKDTNKVFVILKESSSLAEYYETLVKDMEMFSDKKIDIAD